jgi:general secretion pathway protein G
MFEVSMASSRTHFHPAVLLQQMNDLANPDWHDTLMVFDFPPSRRPSDFSRPVHVWKVVKRVWTLPKYLGLAALALALASLMCVDWKPSDHNRTVQARAQLDNFMTALGFYQLDLHSFPTTEEGLQALRVDPGHSGWNGPYLPKDIPLDPWGRAYVYRYPGEHGSGPDIVSYGGDGVPGGEGIYADIVSWAK